MDPAATKRDQAGTQHNETPLLLYVRQPVIPIAGSAVLMEPLLLYNNLFV
jgi:hypothetical protein